MSFESASHTEQSAAEINYRLVRQRLINDVVEGRASRSDVCDAHPELIRAAREVGKPTDQQCPVCAEGSISHVTYVFGPRLPRFGRCISYEGELAKIAKRSGTFVAYVTECCPCCGWNHLVRRYQLEST